MKDKILGILGGMGPMATVDLFEKIVRYTEAGSDNEHIHIIIDNNTSIPDRTDAILKGCKNPVPYMQKSARFLEKSGADAVLMPCNTAHYYIKELQNDIHIPILNMIEITAKEVYKAGISKAGLLATDGTCKSGIYHSSLMQYGIDTIYPCPKYQRVIMNTIYQGVKAGRADKIDYPLLEEVIGELKKSGAEGFILGCTELPIIFSDTFQKECFFDPTGLLAKSAIEYAGKRVKSVLMGRCKHEQS